MKRFLLIICFAFLSFFCIDNVYAETINHLDSSVVIRPESLTLNNTNWVINEFRNFTAGQTFNVKYNGVVYFNRQQNIWQDPFYIRYSLCTDGGLSGGWSNLSNSSDVRMYNTQIRCNFYGSNYEGGRVSFWSFSLKPNEVVADTTTTSFRIKHDLSSAVLRDNSVGLLAIEYSMTPFPIYNETDTLIRQNDTLLSKLDPLTTSMGNVAYNTNVTNEQLMESNSLARQQIQQQQQQQQDFMNVDTSESTAEAGDFFSGFTTNTHGLTGIITAPLTLIGNITSSTCSPLSVPLPFVGENLSLPCMSSIYSRYFGNFYNMYKIITFGIVAYWVCVRVFSLVKDFKNPEHDEIEVMDL